MIKKLPGVKEEKGDSGFILIKEGIMPVIVDKINEIIEELNKQSK